jgi:Tfp pilus assembly protein PilE
VLLFLWEAMIRPQAISQRGTTLIEAMIAAALSALFLGSLFAMNSSSMVMIRMARETAAASQVLQQRIEELRIANWHQVTDATWVRDNLLNQDARGSSQLRNLTETVMLIPYGSSTPGNTKITRSHGLTTIENRNDALLGENSLKVVWSLTYSGVPSQNTMTRQTVAILAKGGVAK